MKKLIFFTLSLLIASWQLQAGEPCDITGCDGCGRSSAWYMNTEGIFFSAINDGASQSFQLQDVNQNIALTPAASSFDADEFTLTPRITLGRTGACGWGVQARYWQMNVDAGQGYAGPFVTPASTPSISVINGNAGLEAYTVDLEATRCLCLFGQDFLGTFGVRHGAIEHSNSQAAFAVSSGGDNYLLSAFNERSFHGTGITYSLSGVRPLRCRNFSLYGGTRFSHLFGDNESTASTSVFLGSPAGTAYATNSAIGSDNDGLFIAETTAGLQWAHGIRRCNALCFARIGFEYQYWNADDANATASSFAAVGGSSLAAATATAGELETHFVGLGLSTGFSW
ncbi:MAG: hypothetical protein KatS3mg111_2709 [Pirellulaceae bacterium]|nr:MAG: hypothetical protein KatS3mg111_2709 [Pirellulaceae bacterium]